MAARSVRRGPTVGPAVGAIVAAVGAPDGVPISYSAGESNVAEKHKLNARMLFLWHCAPNLTLRCAASFDSPALYVWAGRLTHSGR